ALEGDRSGGGASGAPVSTRRVGDRMTRSATATCALTLRAGDVEALHWVAAPGGRVADDPSARVLDVDAVAVVAGRGVERDRHVRRWRIDEEAIPEPVEDPLRLRERRTKQPSSTSYEESTPDRGQTSRRCGAARPVYRVAGLAFDLLCGPR